MYILYFCLEGKKLPPLSPKPMPGRLDREEEGSYYFRPIVTPETEIMALRHSSVTDVSDSAPPSAAWAQVMLIIICSSCATIQCSNVFLFIHTQLLHSRCEHINIHTPLGRYVLGQIPVRRSHIKFSLWGSTLSSPYGAVQRQNSRNFLTISLIQ